LPTPEEALDFFTKVWESDDEEERQAKKTRETPEPAAAADSQPDAATSAEVVDDCLTSFLT
jgi:hypothetical protein